MNLQTFKRIAPGLDKEIAAVAEKYGLKAGKRRATVDELSGTISYRLELVDVNLKDATGATTTPEAERFKLNAAYVGLKPEWLGQTFERGGRKYKIVGMRGGRTVKSILVERDGKNFILEPKDVRRAYGLPAEQSLEEMNAALGYDKPFVPLNR